MILFGLFESSTNSEKLIGFGIVILFFIVFPIFSYYRWKDKKIEDYYLNNENLRKFKENNDL
jgi:hypothetical protein